MCVSREGSGPASRGVPTVSFAAHTPHRFVRASAAPHGTWKRHLRQLLNEKLPEGTGQLGAGEVRPSKDGTPDVPGHSNRRGDRCTGGHVRLPPPHTSTLALSRLPITQQPGRYLTWRPGVLLHAFSHRGARTETQKACGAAEGAAHHKARSQGHPTRGNPPAQGGPPPASPEVRALPG